MSECPASFAEVIVLTEGTTEQLFVKCLLAPYLASHGVYLTPIQLSKPGEKGGDVKFARAKNDIGKHLKQRPDTRITLMVDYYGIKSDWPGHAEAKQRRDHVESAAIMRQATARAVAELFPGLDAERRFLPYVSMHEIEALYFSDPACLAEKLDVEQKRIDAILAECGEPERIDDGRETAPSKRLEALMPRFKKTVTGIAVAEAIGITTMRAKCPLFDAWLRDLESFAENNEFVEELDGTVPGA
ncbi:MAG: DUF4276 family protein [bacterium]|nr:DUF4276 family protein [bacterium]